MSFLERLGHFFDDIGLIRIGSSYAADIDFLIMLVLVVVGVWFLAAELIFVYFIMKFRAKGDGRKADYIDGKDKRHKRWITYPHLAVLVFDVLIIVVSFNVWHKIKMDLPENPDCVIRVTGQQWAWIFQHCGADGELDTADDIFTVDELHVENEKLYHFKLEATDVLHSFSVPVWRIKQDAIPGRSITGWFEPTAIGDFDIQCAEICGFGHSVMRGRVMVEDAETHAAWVAANTPATAAVPSDGTTPAAQ